jgi:RNA-directed DNA polymerase
MLITLESGVKGGKWYSLYDKVHSRSNLDAAWKKSRANRGAPGVDQITIQRYEQQLDHHQETLREQLQKRTYQALPNRRKMIDKPGSKEQRPLGIPCVRDRIAQGALRQVLEPIFEQTFADHSYGFRPGRSCKDALSVVDTALQEGWTHVVDADLKCYFDTINHQKLLQKLRCQVSDGRVLKLITAFLKQKVMLDGNASVRPAEGTPQGGVISPLLSNIYLNDLDHLIASHGWSMVRYADDFVVLCRSAEAAAAALEVVREWTAANDLQLHPTKTEVIDMTVANAEFTFLGYRFQRSPRDGGVRRWPSRKAQSRLKERLRPLTKRTCGMSIDECIKRVNVVQRGWYEYFQQCSRNTWPSLDGWVRRRMRSILRKRSKRRGVSKGKDHQRWTNAYFLEHGYISLEVTYAETMKSLRGTH